MYYAGRRSARLCFTGHTIAEKCKPRLTNELRSHAWGRTVKEKGEGKSEILYLGDWLYYESRLKGVPLVMPETVVF